MKLKAAIITIAFVMVATAFIATSSPEMTDGASEVEWTIDSADDMVRLSAEIQNAQPSDGGTVAYYYANVQLNADITLGSDWIRLGEALEGKEDETHILRGEFDGNGHTITLEKSSGLMKYAGPIYVHDLKIIANETTGPALTEYLYGSVGDVTTIQNVVVDGSTTYGKGFISRAYSMESATEKTSTDPEIKIIDCVNNATINEDSDNRGVGILAGIYGANVLIEKCRNNGNITLSTTEEAHAAGIVGYIMRDDGKGRLNENSSKVANLTVSIINCENYGNISSVNTSGRGNAGGIASTLHEGVLLIKGCNNYGDITTDSSTAIPDKSRKVCAGGIAGKASADSSITGCNNYGKISGIGSETQDFASAYAGGIVGFADNNSSTTVSNCGSFGTVGSEGKEGNNYSGQVIGAVTKDGTATTVFSISNISVPEGTTALCGKGACTSESSTTVITVVEPGEIAMDRTSATMKITEGLQLGYTLSPSGATERSVTWKSSETGVAIVNNGGYLLAKSEGTATITVTTSNGLTATCQVTVTKADDGSKGQEPTTTTETDPSGTTTTVTEYPDGTKVTVVEDSTTTSTTTETKTSVTDAPSSTTISTTTVVVKDTDDQVTSAEAKVNVEVEVDASTESAPVEITENVVTAALDTIAVDEESEAVLTKTVTITVDTTQISLTAEATKTVSDSGASLEFIGSAGTMTADTKVVETLASQDDSLIISFVEIDDVVLPDVQQTIEDSTAYRLTVTKSDGTRVHELKGTVDLTVEYTPPASVSAAEVVVIYVADDGTMEAVETTYDPDTKILRFSTDHFSYFMVGTLSMLPTEPDVDPPVVIIPDDDEYFPPYVVPTRTENDDDSKKVLACAAAAVVAALMAAFLVIDRKR